MKGFGVFSPSNATSRYVMMASGLQDSSSSSIPRAEFSPVSLNLLNFTLNELKDGVSEPFSQSFDSHTNFSQFNNETPFSLTGNNFNDYMSPRTSEGMAEFSLLHSTPVDLPNSLTTMKWLKLCTNDEKSLVAFGSSSGELFLYDGESFVENRTLVSTLSSKVCNAPLCRLGYSGRNLLALAGSDGQVSVADLADPTCPILDVSFGKWRVGLVTALSWNCRLPHILASCGAAMAPSDTSGVVVWDLKVRKPASTFRDPTGRVNPVGVDWVPDQPTQLIVGYGDDVGPCVQLWDLRNCSAPLCEERGHTRGLTDLRFSPHDPTVFVSSGKDDVTRVWCLSGEREFRALSSFRTEALSHHSRVEWHPFLPGVFMSQANDGELALHNAFSGVLEASYMPQWVRKRCGLTSGFAGQVASFSSSGQVQSFALSSSYEQSDLAVLNRTLDLVSVLSDEKVFLEVCDSRLRDCKSEPERLTWSLFKLQYKSGLSNLLNLFGFSASEFERLAQSVNLNQSSSVNSGVMGEVLGVNYFTNRTSSLSEVPSHDDKEAEDFFDSLTNNNFVTLDHSVNSVNSVNQVNLVNLGDTTQPSSNTVDSVDLGDKGIKDELDWCGDLALKNSLINCDYGSASRRCLELNRVVESLLLSYVGGQELFLEVVERVVEAKRDPFLNLVYLLMQGDVEYLVDSARLADWKETLCVLYTYTPDLSAFRGLCSRFAKRLLSHNMYQEANIGFIISLDFENSANLLRMGCLGSGGNSLEDKMEMMVNLAVLSFSTRSCDVDENFDSILVELAELFLDAGLVQKALETLSVSGASNSNELKLLKDKIQSLLSTTSNHIQPNSHTVNPSQQNSHSVLQGYSVTQDQHSVLYPSQSSGLGQQNSHGVLGQQSQQSQLGTQNSVSVSNIGIRSMTSLNTRTVPLTALQSSSSSYPVSRQTGSQSLTTAQSSTTHLPSSTASGNFSSYSSLHHSSSNASFAAPNTASQPNSQLLHTLSHNTHNTTQGQSGVGQGKFNAPGVQTSRPGSFSAQSHTVSHSMAVPQTSRPASFSHSYSNQTTHSTNTGVPTQSTQYTQSTGLSVPTQYSGLSGLNMSSAPSAVAGAVKPGMPIPWPNPTPTQQMSSKTLSTQESNKLIIASSQAPQGEKMPQADLDLVTSTLNSLTAKLGDSKPDSDSKRNIEALLAVLNSGGLSNEANTLLATLCRAVANGDTLNSNVVLNNVISKLWNNQNKPWIMALKRIVPK